MLGTRFWRPAPPKQTSENDIHWGLTLASEGGQDTSDTFPPRKVSLRYS